MNPQTKSSESVHVDDNNQRLWRGSLNGEGDSTQS